MFVLTDNIVAHTREGVKWEDVHGREGVVMLGT
jgi:hypothetical protein